MNSTIVMALVAGLVMLASIVSGDVTSLGTIELAESPTATTYTISPSGVVQYQEYAMSNPSRLVIDLVGVKNGVQSENLRVDGRLITAVRASQFQSEPDLVTRVVFELAEGTRYKVSRKGEAIEVAFTGAPEVMGASMAGESAMAAPTEAPAAAPANTESTQPVAEPEAAQPASTPAAAVAEAESDWTRDAGADDAPVWPEASDEAPAGDEIVLAQNTSRAAAEMSTPVYGSTLSNQPISIDVQGADIKTVLRSISEFSGVNIIAAPDVEGPVVIHLKDVPWKEALDSILKSQGYDWRDDYGIIRVAPVDQLQEDEVKAVTVDRKKEEMQSLTSRVVKLNYLNAKEVKTAMNKVSTPRGSVEAEQGTNTVIISDVPSRVEKIVAMLKEMDTRLSQVEIVAKMVDVDAEVTRELGVNWQALNLQAGSAAGDIVTGARMADPFGTVRVGTVQSWGDLNLIIEALEKDNKANIVSNPRVTTADNQEARIMVGKEIPLIVSDEAGNPITELKKIGVILRVTPHVNSDETVTLDLHPELSDLAAQATVQGGVIINLQEADTRVVVRDGETAVIGGLISETESSLKNGVPVLKDVPLLGPLFRYESKTKKKRELIIFVTPKIVG
ncbi:MAG TPA: type IV pilus secretin PilQ [Candidatus Krumholzibacteria bacterium]|nr:type IV pilus secretin PilQ [Candidatus Krumholzibacteria bacterium]